MPQRLHAGREAGVAVRQVLITTQVYPPEAHPTAVMVRELAESLVASGTRVTVCCGFPHHPSGRLPPGWSFSVWQRTEERGVRVIRVGHFLHPSRSIPVRGAVFVSQGVGVAVGALLSERADVVVAYGPPLLGANLGAVVAARHRARLVNVIYDLYPDIAVETGRVTSRFVIGAARIAERLQYLATDMTVVLSEGLKRQLVARGVRPAQIAVVPVWLDPDEIKPGDRYNRWRREQGIPTEKLVVLYAGTIGVVSGATVVAEAAARLRDRPDIMFVLVGDGEARPLVEARTRELRLENVRFIPFQPRSRLPEVQATADIGLVTLEPGRGRTSVPSKVLGYMAAGRPIVASVDSGSDTALEVQGAGSGVVVPPGDAAALAQAVRTAADDEGWREEAGARGRARLVAGYAKESVLRRYRELLEEVARA